MGGTWFLPLALCGVPGNTPFVARGKVPSFSRWRGRWTSEVVKKSGGNHIGSRALSPLRCLKQVAHFLVAWVDSLIVESVEH